MRQDQGQRHQDQYLSHDSKQKRIPCVAHGHKRILIDHLKSQEQNGRKHDPHCLFCQQDKLRIIRKHPADRLRKEYQRRPHQGRTSNAQNPRIMNGLPDPGIIFCTVIVAEQRLSSGHNAKKRHKKHLAGTAQDCHGSKMQVCLLSSVSQKQPVEQNHNDGFVNTEGAGRNPQCAG